MGLLAALKGRGLPVHGLIVGGEDPHRPRYAEQIRQQAVGLGLTGDVTFTGHRDDLREIVAASDLVVSLSAKPESFGRTVLEALSLGAPVVGYAHGGVGEILASVFPDGKVPVGDQRTLVDTASRLLHSPTVTVPVVNGYRLDDMLNATLGLYQELAA